MKHNRNLVFIVIAVIAVLMISLQIAASNLENDPNESDNANACFAGGSMEGKCITEQDWEAGWYVIRYEYGLISAEDFPDWLKWAIPNPGTTEEPRDPTATYDYSTPTETSTYTPTPIYPTPTETPTNTPTDTPTPLP